MDFYKKEEVIKFNAILIEISAKQLAIEQTQLPYNQLPYKKMVLKLHATLCHNIYDIIIESHLIRVAHLKI